jgi:hypothetical protein
MLDPPKGPTHRACGCCTAPSTAHSSIGRATGCGHEAQHSAILGAVHTAVYAVPQCRSHAAAAPAVPGARACWSRVNPNPSIGIGWATGCGHEAQHSSAIIYILCHGCSVFALYILCTLRRTSRHAAAAPAPQVRACLMELELELEPLTLALASGLRPQGGPYTAYR